MLLLFMILQWTLTHSTKGIEPTNHCDPNPCQNSGLCSYNTTSPYFTCDCTHRAFEGASCSERRFVSNGTCQFHVYYDKTFSFTHESAKNICINEGGTLAMMKSAAIQDFVESVLIDQYGEDGDVKSLWIGGHKPQQTWIWMDGTKIPLTSGFQHWDGNYNNGNKMLMTSWRSTRDNLRWAGFPALQTRYAFVCEKSETTDPCEYSDCVNRGVCVAIGCQVDCDCPAGYGGEKCEIDLLTIQLLQSSFVINPGEVFTVALNINSTDGPTVVTLKKTSDGTIQTTRNKVNGVVNITSVPLWEIKSSISFTITAAPYFNPSLYSREAIVHVTVRQPEAPGNLEVAVCRMKVTISFSADISSMKLQHKISIIRSDNSQIVKSKEISSVSTGKITETFEGLQALSNFKAQVTVCEDRCTMPSMTNKSFVTRAAIPDQVVQYFLVTKIYNQDTCRLHWAVVDDVVDEFKITIISQRLSDGQSDQETKSVTGSARDLDFHAQPDRSYNFKIQAITCAGLGVELGRIGDCVTKTGDIGSPETNTNGSLATTVLSAVFGILLLISVSAHLVNFILKRKKEKSTEKQPAAKEVAGPYQTTYFDETNDSQDQEGYEVPIQTGSSASGFDGDRAIQDTQQENSYQYENFMSSV